MAQIPTEQFDIWWKASKYCQVVIPKEGWRQIALDGWNAGQDRFPSILLEQAGFTTISTVALDQIHQRNKHLDARNQKLEALLRKEGIDPDA